jgi:hypothetical protein
MSGNTENKIVLPMKYEDAVSALLKVKPEPKKKKEGRGLERACRPDNG